MRRSRFLVLPVFIALLAAPAAVDARCARRVLVLSMLTPSAGTVPRDGAVVAGLLPAAGGPEGMPASFSLVRGRRSTPMRSEAIAPGLVRLVPEGRVAGSYRIEGVAGSADVIFARPGLPGAPPAPRLDHAERYLVARGREQMVEVRAHFEHPIPENVIAIVTYWGDDPEPDGFVRAIPMAQEQIVYGRGRCDPEPEGTHAPPEGETTLRVAFVDRVGQVSPLSGAQALR